MARKSRKAGNRYRNRYRRLREGLVSELRNRYRQEDRVFADRLRFDQAKFWHWNDPEYIRDPHARTSSVPQSLCGTSWAAVHWATQRFTVE
jgi:hypothetical protein